MWNRTAETMSRDEYSALQLKGLKKSLDRVWTNEFYRERMKRGGLGSPEDVKSLDDLASLPFFTKDDVFPIGALPRTEGKAKRVIRRKAE